MKKSSVKPGHERGDDAVFSNGTLEFRIPVEFGPRVLFAGFKDRQNLFSTPDISRKTPFGDWNIFGGHRFWLSPETFPETYYPDNDRVGIRYAGKKLVVSQKIRKLGLEKEIELAFTAKNSLSVTHRFRNTGKSRVRFALWALSVMKKGGFAIIPQNRGDADSHGLLPNRNLVLWPYTDVEDRRFFRNDRYYFVRQGGPAPFKIGQRIDSGWCAYSCGDCLFVKRFVPVKGGDYPDFQSNVEVYSCKDFLELETLSPLFDIGPGGSCEYREIWEFHKGKKIPFGAETIRI